MAQTFFFYDLETSGINPRTSRVMQFAGQRTTLDLEPIGRPINILIKLSPDVVPEPDAILITGITPQQTIQEGVTEAEFLKQFHKEVALPDTIYIGFNSVRFDDEFMRFLLYRNFYDPYEWQWKDSCSRWDLLDVVRMTRALRPEGIKWPVDSKGKPSNRLELLAAINGFDHKKAHDALSDVEVSIDLARLLKNKQPKLFDYLFGLRNKRTVSELVLSGEPFVYSSGKYPDEYQKTTAAVSIAKHPSRPGALVYDLRHDPKQFAELTPEALAELWRYKKDREEPQLPIKTMRFNCCPAAAPLGVLDDASQKRIKIDLQQITKNLTSLSSMQAFPGKVLKALEILDKQQQTSLLSDNRTVDEQLYDGFFGEADKKLETKFRASDPKQLLEIADKFADKRLKALAPLYKARNFPEALTDDERSAWDKHVSISLLAGGESSRLAKYFVRLGELSEKKDLTQNQRYLLEELQIYGQSIMPVIDEPDA